MGNKVDISEVIEFSNDFSTASESLQTQLKEVENNIEKLTSMENFSGTAASNAKKYFGELHLTLLKSFEHVLTELEERLKNHLTVFESTVDSSESAIVNSGYLENTVTDIDDTHESFIDEQELVRQTLADVSDISSANHPSTLTFDSTYDKVNKVITKLEENFETYTTKDIEDSSSIDELHQQIETTIKDSGEVTDDNEFIYFMGSVTPDSLLDLQGYNQGKHKDMMDDAEDARDKAMSNMDEDSQQIASQAFDDLSSGKISEEEYYAYLEELKKLNSGEDADEEVPTNFINYIRENENLAESYEENVLSGVIDELLTADGKDKIRRADLIKDMNAGKPGSGSYLRELGKNSLRIGNAVVSGLAALTVISGTYDDYHNTDKEWGEAAAKNSAAGFVTATASGYVGATVLAAATTAGAVTPVGWAVLAGAGTATVVTAGFNYAYDNNFLGLQTGLDWAGNTAEKVGDAVVGFFRDSVFGSG